jgi:hypothetical protein
MKDLIIQALNDAIIVLDKRVPQTKKETIYENIEGISPLDISRFIIENNIPKDAYFGGKPNDYDSFDTVCLCYDIDVPMTEQDKLKIKRKTFSTIAYKLVFDLLIKSGYKRVGFNSGKLKEFDDTTVYDMFITKDFDRLVKYYSLSFNLL